MTLRVVFMGSPEFALASLRHLAMLYPVVGVVTQPDRPAGRGQVLTPPPVKTLAASLQIPVIQPNRLKEPAAWEQLQAWQPDLIVVAAFGQILRQNVLDLPRYGCINVHASLLPRWRGAAPIQAAILAGDEKTGVTIMKMDAGVDSGAILAQADTPINAQDDAESLAGRLAEMGADLLVKTLPGYLDGSIQPQAQDEAGVTRAVMIRKEDGLLDFSKPVEALERQVRAFRPWPGTFFTWQNAPLKVVAAHIQADSTATPALRSNIGHLPAVGAPGGWLVLDEVQPAGKKAMPGDVFLRGARAWVVAE